MNCTGYTRIAQRGGNGGSGFTDNLTEVTKIKAINIRHGENVDSIQTIWQLANGSELTGERHGGDGGSLDSFTLAENEYIVRISGRSGRVIDRLIFFTNLGNQYGPFGGDGGSQFQPIENVTVGGFFGRSGRLLDAIGVFSCQ